MYVVNVGQQKEEIMQRKRKKKEGCWFCREKRDEKKGGFIGSEILTRIYFHSSPTELSTEIYGCSHCGRSTDSPPLPFQKKVEKTIKELERRRKTVTKMILKKFAVEKWLSQRFLKNLKRRGIEIITI